MYKRSRGIRTCWAGPESKTPWMVVHRKRIMNWEALVPLHEVARADSRTKARTSGVSVARHTRQRSATSRGGCPWRWATVLENAGNPAEVRRILDFPVGQRFRVRDLPAEDTYDGEGPGNPMELRRSEIPAYLFCREPISPAGE